MEWTMEWMMESVHTANDIIILLHILLVYLSSVRHHKSLLYCRSG